MRAFGAAAGERELSSLADDARIQWREPLDAESLARVAGWLANHPAASLRLRGPAVSQLARIAGSLPEALSLEGASAGAFDAGRFPRVRSLQLEGMPRDLGAALDAFPDLRHLRVAARGERLDASALQRRLEVLDLSCVRAGPDLRALARCGGLRALRLYRIAGLTKLAGLEAHRELRDLALCGLLGLDDVEMLAELPRLRALELTGMWQLGLPAVEVLGRLPSLAALRIDIGGRRKNVEVQRRLGLAVPGPFGRSGFERA